MQRRNGRMTAWMRLSMYGMNQCQRTSGGMLHTFPPTHLTFLPTLPYPTLYPNYLPTYMKQTPMIGVCLAYLGRDVDGHAPVAGPAHALVLHLVATMMHGEADGCMDVYPVRAGRSGRPPVCTTSPFPTHFPAAHVYIHRVGRIGRKGR